MLKYVWVRGPEVQGLESGSWICACYNLNFDPNAVYCGNVSACFIKIKVCAASPYKFVMEGADIVEVFLVTKYNPKYD